MWGMPEEEQERKNMIESLEKENHPFGTHLCAPVTEIYLTGTTSGTTGTPTFSYTFTKNDVERHKAWDIVLPLMV
jgi:phenylacetate-CoA ligase